MNLSNYERLILINQNKILAKLDPDNSESYERIQDTLSLGLQHLYRDDIFDCSFFHEPIKKEIYDEVLNILDMFFWLKESYEKLEDRSEIEQENIDLISFKGFSINFEPDHYHCADFIYIKQKRFSGLIEHNKIDSHFPLLSQYRKMFDTWVTLEKKQVLSKNAIINITNSVSDKGSKIKKKS